MDAPGAVFLIVGDVLRWIGFALSPLLLLPLSTLIAPGLVGGVSGRVADGLNRITGMALKLAMATVVLMALAQLTVVVIRQVFGLAFSWLDETVVYAFAATFLLAAAGALRDDAHVRVDILRPRFTPQTRAAIELVGSYLFIFPIGVLVLWAVEPSLARSWAGLEGSRESDGLPIYFLLRTLMPVFAVLLILQGVSNALTAALGLRGLRELDDGERKASVG
ncbi:MAG: TRAP transporter small permease subunit [Pseudomonadota bacterium]